MDVRNQPVITEDEHDNLTPKLYWESAGLHSRHLPNGKIIQKEYDVYVHDLVSCLVYIGEPVRLQRHRIDYMVLTFLFVAVLPLVYPLKKEFRKNVH